MVDKHGKIMVVGDYEGDLKAIVDGLNSLRWNFGYSDGEEHKWAVEQDRVRKFGSPDISEREIIVLNGNVPRPSLRPMGHFLVLRNGRRCFPNDAGESFMKQWNKDEGAHDWDECTLMELSALISQHLNKGTIAFVAAHTSRGYISHERLVISADGDAEWDNCNSSNGFGLDRWTLRETERYPLEY